MGKLGITQGSVLEAAREEVVAGTDHTPHQEDRQNRVQGLEKEEDIVKKKPGKGAEALQGIVQDPGEDLLPPRKKKVKDTKTRVEV